MKALQKTIKDEIELRGYGVHSGLASNIILRPAPPNSGVVFFRKNNKNENIAIKACYNNVYKTSLCTALASDSTNIFTIDTVEHLLSAICACDIDNIFIDITSNEVPIFDGSAIIFVDAFEQISVIEQNAIREYYKIRTPVRVENGFKFAEFLPYEGTCYDVTIKFENPSIGYQNTIFDMHRGDYKNEIAPARTFGFLADAEYLRAKGMALGASLNNSIVIGNDNNIINPEGLRLEKEFVRHKLLDAIGDTFLLGKRFIGKFRSYCSGHDLNLKLVEKLIKTI